MIKNRKNVDLWFVFHFPLLICLARPKAQLLRLPRFVYDDITTIAEDIRIDAGKKLTDLMSLIRIVVEWLPSQKYTIFMRINF